jgi:uncharacterized SAM-binding protein YcdF (DUF218 family)
MPRRSGALLHNSMTTAGLQRGWRVFLRMVLTALAIAGIAALCFLPFAGRYLIVQDPLERSDLIVVLAGARAERWLEAVDLYRNGWAPRILLSGGRLEEAEVQLEQMGIRYPREAELARDAMVQMKIPSDAIAILSNSLDNTAQEAIAVHRMVEAAGYRRLIVVTSKYHTRRTSFAFSREFRGTPVRVLIRASQYDRAKPDRWWTDRADFRYVTSELQKLLVYRLGLGG